VEVLASVPGVGKRLAERLHSPSWFDKKERV
jgi:Holliday junction resolvasome RuvABC DNA-binding subunit